MNKSYLQLLQIPCCVYCAISTKGAAVFEFRQLFVCTNTPGAPTTPYVV